MDFWNQHDIWFVIGLILWPRVLLIYFGLIPPMSIPPILGMTLIPRLSLAGIMTSTYWETNPTLVVICWIMAIVCDIWALSIKWRIQKMAYQAMTAASTRAPSSVFMPYSKMFE